MTGTAKEKSDQSSLISLTSDICFFLSLFGGLFMFCLSSARTPLAWDSNKKNNIKAQTTQDELSICRRCYPRRRCRSRVEVNPTTPMMTMVT